MKRIILALALFAGGMMAYAQSEVKNDTIAAVSYTHLTLPTT